MGKYKYCKVQLIHETWDMTICNRHTDEEDISIENLVPGFDLARAAGNEKMRIKVVNIDDKQIPMPSPKNEPWGAASPYLKALRTPNCPRYRQTPNIRMYPQKNPFPGRKAASKT